MCHICDKGEANKSDVTENDDLHLIPIEVSNLLSFFQYR